MMLIYIIESFDINNTNNVGENIYFFKKNVIDLFHKIRIPEYTVSTYRSYINKSHLNINKIIIHSPIRDQKDSIIYNI